MSTKGPWVLAGLILQCNLGINWYLQHTCWLNCSYLLINSRKVKPLITERNDYLLPGIKKNYMLEWLKASVKTGNDHQKLNVHLRHIPFNLILSYFFFSPKSPLSLIFLVRFLETLILPKNNYNLGVFSYPPEAIA